MPAALSYSTSTLKVELEMRIRKSIEALWKQPFACVPICKLYKPHEEGTRSQFDSGPHTRSIIFNSIQVANTSAYSSVSSFWYPCNYWKINRSLTKEEVQNYYKLIEHNYTKQPSNVLHWLNASFLLCNSCHVLTFNYSRAKYQLGQTCLLRSVIHCQTNSIN
jgi:hypothetical protein